MWPNNSNFNAVILNHLLELAQQRRDNRKAQNALRSPKVRVYTAIRLSVGERLITIGYYLAMRPKPSIMPLPDVM
jgi:hypothetical protein